MGAPCLLVCLFGVGGARGAVLVSLLYQELTMHTLVIAIGWGGGRVDRLVV